VERNSGTVRSKKKGGYSDDGGEAARKSGKAVTGSCCGKVETGQKGKVTSGKSGRGRDGKGFEKFRPTKVEIKSIEGLDSFVPGIV
jgi:hypothetical protein